MKSIAPAFISSQYRQAILFYSGKPKSPQLLSIQKPKTLSSWARRIRTFTMTESESVALPFGDSPLVIFAALIATAKIIIHIIPIEVKYFFIFLYLGCFSAAAPWDLFQEYPALSWYMDLTLYLTVPHPSTLFPGSGHVPVFQCAVLLLQYLQLSHNLHTGR